MWSKSAVHAAQCKTTQDLSQASLLLSVYYFLLPVQLVIVLVWSNSHYILMNLSTVCPCCFVWKHTLESSSTCTDGPCHVMCPVSPSCPALWQWVVFEWHKCARATLGSAWAGLLLTAHVCYCTGAQVHVLNTCAPVAWGHAGARVPALMPRTSKSSPVSGRHVVAGVHTSSLQGLKKKTHASTHKWTHTRVYD